MMRAGRLMEDGFEKLGVKAILAKDRYNQLLYYRKSSPNERGGAGGAKSPGPGL